MKVDPELLKQMAVVVSAKKKIDAARAELDAALEAMLLDAVKGVAAQYPGYEVCGCSAMGTWDIIVYGVRFTDVGDEVAADAVGVDTYTHDIVYDSRAPSEWNHYSRGLPVFSVLDDVYRHYGTYPVVKFTVDKSGVLTCLSEW